MAAVTSTGFKLPDRKVLASGLAGIAAWLVSMAMEHWAGIDIPSEALGGFIMLLVPTVAYLVPPSVADVLARLDAAARNAADHPDTAPKQEVLAAAAVVKDAIATAAR